MSLFMKILRQGKSLLIDTKIPITTLDRRIENFIKIIDEGHGNKNSFLVQKPVNAIGEPIPWFTYPSIEYINQLDLTEVSMLEWGIGSSTLYFATRCKKIISLNH